ncbi:hypothetical protein MPSEU_000878800 [Mayamaea pseudoterrestris]|nr:hypothetical protein MPSEU_000878800 [Mayamaea pseudoterrestris]
MSTAGLLKLVPSSAVASVAAAKHIRTSRNLAATAAQASTTPTPMKDSPTSKIAPNNQATAKKTKKCRKQLDQDPADQQSQSFDKHQPLPPGKKTVRKLRYQQQRLSPKEFVLSSADSLQYTGSVVVDKSSLAGELTSPSKVIVRTSSSLQTEDIGALSAKQATQINIQPLLILDINGILCHRIRKSRIDTYDPNATYRPTLGGPVANTPIVPRPFLLEFLTDLQQYFTLAIWTSAKKKTATQLIRRLVPEVIANRFLFVWAQHDCHVQQFDRQLANSDPAHPKDALFEKDLSKVWTAYPLWNVQNTLLIDDSPEKCVAFRKNAIHPPPLHGRVIDSYSTHLVSDEVNNEQQLRFLRDLAQHWKEYPLVQEWGEEADGTVCVSSTRTQANFLQDNTSGYFQH